MYAIYKQTHPPTGVEHCVHCHFLSSVESNLVVAGTSQLRIYKFYSQEEVGFNNAPSSYIRKTELVSCYLTIVIMSKLDLN